MDSFPILFAGAGPTGLTMAAFLVQFDIPFRIIDKGIAASNKSKALVVQARTLEIFQQLALDKKAVEAGAGVGNFIVHTKGKEVARVRLTDDKQNHTPFPFAEVLPQDRTEGLLIDYLQEKGISVEWNTELVEVQQEKNGVLLSLQNGKDGSTETLKADYLVGTDGAHSKVRHSMNTNFVGGAYQQGFMLADLEVDWDVRKNGLLVFLEQQFFCIFFPFKTPGKYRLITLLPKAQKQADFAFLKNFVESNLSLPIELKNPVWISNYRVHHRCVEHFREGRIFLAGDSAHIHSPAGGQGMNTGIQDAHNLAWKLAMVVKGIAKDSFLDSYHLERWRIAQHLVNGTDRGFKMIAHPSPVLSWLRTNVFAYFIGGLSRFKRVQRLMFHFVSQTHINYERHYTAFNYLKHPVFKAGSRFPWQKEALANGKNIYDYLQPNSFHLFLLEVGSPFDASIVADLQNQLGAFLKVHSFLQKEETQFFAHYQVQSSIAVCVRPDMHIACVGGKLEEVKDYFSSIVY